MTQGPIVVTGATGFAGSHLLDLLAREGQTAIGCRRPSSRVPAPRPGISWLEIDLLDRDRVEAMVADVRPGAIYHCAGAPHVGTSWTHTTSALAANVLTTHHVLSAVRRSVPECRVLVTGSAMVYRTSDEALTESSPLGPSSPYGVSKLAQEMLARRAHDDDGVDLVLTRSFNHIGPRQDPGFVTSAIARQIALIEAGRSPAVLTVGNLDTRRDVTDVRDTVRGYRAVMTKGQPGSPYNVCTGRALPIRQLVRELVAQANVKVEIRTDPALLRPNDTPLVLGDPRRVQHDTGWAPEIPIERTLSDLLAYWRDLAASS
jgi:GDP-4-dehydro-6-deoxy-D-mannose reductase